MWGGSCRLLPSTCHAVGSRTSSLSAPLGMQHHPHGEEGRDDVCIQLIVGQSGAGKKKLMQGAGQEGYFSLRLISVKSTVSNNPSQNGLIGSIPRIDIRDPLSSLLLLPPSKHVPVVLLTSRMSRLLSRQNPGASSVCCRPDYNLLSLRHKQEEWVFQYPVHTSAHPLPDPASGNRGRGG